MKNIEKLLKNYECPFKDITVGQDKKFTVLYEYLSVKEKKNSSGYYSVVRKLMEEYSTNLYSNLKINREDLISIFKKNEILIPYYNKYSIVVSDLVPILGHNIFWLVASEVLKEKYPGEYFYQCLYDRFNNESSIVVGLTKDCIDYYGEDIILFKYYESLEKKIKYIKGKLDITIKNGKWDLFIVDSKSQKPIRLTEYKRNTFNVAFSEEHFLEIKEYYKNAYIKDIVNKLDSKEKTKNYYTERLRIVDESIEKLENELVISEAKFDYIFEI